MKTFHRFAVTFALLTLTATAAQAAVTVTPASGGTNISADTAANATTPSYTTLGNIVITEGADTDFAVGAGVTLVLNPPSGWSFNAGAGSVAATNGRNITGESISVTSSAATVTFTVGGTNKTDTMTISGLQVRPNDGVLTNTPAGNITRNASSTSTISGVSGATNFGSLSMTFGAAKKLSVSTQPSPTATAGSAFATQPVIRVEDQHGNLRTTDNTTVVTAARNGGGSPAIQGTLTATAAGGLATFTNLSHNKAETISLAFTASGLTGTTSNNIVVSAANATAIAFTTHPSGATAGAAFTTQPVVQSFDAYGNLSTTGLAASVPITFTVASGPGSFHGSSTTVYDIGTGAGNGTVTATNLRIDTAGTHTLGASGLGSATSNSFAVSAAAPSVLAMVQQPPASATAGVAFSPSVTVRINDAFGNQTTSTATVSAARNTGSGTASLQGTTSTAAVAGLATFSNLKYNVAGETISIDFASTGLTGTTSSSVTINPGSAASFDVTAPGVAVAGNAISVTVIARDSVGNVATGYTGTVHFTSNDGNATLPGDYAFTGGDAGVHVFSVTLKTAGSRTVTATDGGVTGTSNSVSVAAGSAASLTVSAPASATAGNAFSITVTAKDAYNNTAPSYSGTVQFTSSDGNATLPGNYTFTGGDNGVHTFTNEVTLTTAGTRSITATDSVTGSINGSTNVNVIATTATSLTITAPATATAGSAFNVTVTARDIYNNIATGYTGTVAFTSNDGNATLPSNHTFTGADAGTRTFAVTLKTAGNRTVSITDGSLNATSNTIAVSAGSAASLTVTAPGSATAGISFNFTVTARDAFNNIATGYTGTVAFTSTDGIATLPSNYTFTGGDAGTRTFSATLKTAGTRTITANDGTLSDASDNISVSAGAAASFTVSLPASVTAGAAFSATVTAKDAFNNTATTYTGTVQITSDDSQGVMPSNYTFTGGDAGVHTFTNAVTLKTAGIRNVTATDTVSAPVTGSSSMTVNAATVDKLAFTTQPSGAVAGSTFTTVVKTQDAFGNNSIAGLNNNVNIAIAINTGTGVLQGTTPINAGNFGATPGTATFNNLRIDTAGTKTLAATNNQLTGATSNSFVVAPGPATTLLFTTQPGSATAGSAFGSQPAIKTQDAFGNDSASGLGLNKVVTIALTSGTGTLQGTTTVDIGTAAGNGSGTYSGLRIDTAGSKQLSVSAAALTGANSNLFTVSAGPAAVIVKLAGDGQTAPAGSTLPTAPSVRVEDAFSNTIASQNVTFSPAAGSGSVTGGSQTTNGSGVATVTSWTIGPTAGGNTLNVTAGSASTTFTATGICNYTTVQSGNWNDASTWVGGCLPTAADAATIASGHTVTVTAPATVNTLTFASNTADSNVAVSAGVTFTVTGLLRIQAPLNANVTSTMNVGNGTLQAGSLELNGAGNRTAVLLIHNGTAVIDGNATFPGNPPTQQVTITGAGTLEMHGNFAAGATLALNSASTVLFNGSGPQSIGNYNPNNYFSNLIIDSTVTLLGNLPVNNLTINSGEILLAGSGNIHLRGNMTVNGAINTSGNLNVIGTSAQTIGGSANPINLMNVTMNNAAGLTLTQNVQMGGVLTLTSGNISTGTNTLTIIGTGGITRTNGHVIGNLARVFDAAATYTYTVGTANGYSPVTIAATAGSFPATVTVKAVQSAHPNSPTTNALQRYWTITNGGLTSANLTFNYLAGDVVGNELAYRLARYSAGWTYPAASVDTINHVASASGIGSFGDFTLHAQAVGIAITSVNGGANPVAGTPFDVNIAAVDALGNPTGVPAATSLTLSLNTGTGPLGGTLTGNIAFGNSSTTISGVTYTKAEGGVILTATATGGVNAADDSDPFTVDPGPTTHFTVTAPNSATAGTAFNTTINAYDAYENLTPAFAGTVIVTSTDSNATLPPNGTLTGGTRTDSITLRTAGGQTITATSGLITGSAEVLVNAGPTTHFTVSAPASVTAGDPFSATVTARDAFENTTTGYLGTAAFTSSDSGATLPSNYTFTGGDSGAHTFNGLSLITAGNQTVTATDNALTGQAAINVTAGTLDHFLVEAAGGGSIAPQTAGAAFNLRLTAQDAYNNTVTSFTGPVQITSNATLTGAPLTSSAFVNGVVASQSVTITTAQTGTTVSVTDTPSGRNGTSNAFTVNPAGTASFLIEAASGGDIAPQIAGVPFSVRITARDAFGNTDTSFTGTVDLTSNAGAVSPLTATFAGGDNGVKTISVTLTNANAAATLTATHTPSGNTGTSNAFVVSGAGAASYLVEAGGGGNIGPQTAGVPFSVRVTARDSFGNTATGFTGIVALSTNAGSITPLSLTFTGGDNGVKSASVTLTASGTGRTITATAGGTGTSNGFTVNAGALDHFLVEAAGGGAIPAQNVNVPFAIRITALDANNNVVVSFNGAGNTAGISANGTLSAGSGTTAAFSNGVLASHSVTFSNSGNFTITATRTGGSETGSASVTVNGAGGGPSALVSAASGNTICAGNTALITVALAGSAPFSLTWSDGLVETTSSATHVRTVQPLSTTIYTIVSVTDGTSNSAAGTGSATVTVNAIDPPSILPVANVQIGQPLTLRAAGGYDAYQWYRNGTAIRGATSITFTIAAVADTDAGSYSVAGSRGGCLSHRSVPFVLIPPSAGADDAIIPVVGNANGMNGSRFRTTMYLVNDSGEVEQGDISFPMNNAGPSAQEIVKYAYTLNPGESKFIDDMLPPSFSGITSASVHRLRGSMPDMLIHVFNDGGDLGTSGMIEQAIPLGSELVKGDQAVLVTPIDPDATRFNIGMRALTGGLTVRITRRTKDGATLGTIERTVAAGALVQEAYFTMFGVAPGSSESLTFEVTAGSGVIYGAATDNRSNDPNMQMASKLGVKSASGRYVLPVAGSLLGAFGSRFATGLQIHNPADSQSAATLTFHPANASAGGSDPKLDVTIPARGTLAFDDVVASMNTSGIGSLDLATNANLIALARVYSIATTGQTSLMTDLLPEEQALRAGQSGTLMAPHSLTAARFNIGVRTFGSGAAFTATIRSASGQVIKTVPLTFGPSYFTQANANALLAYQFTGDESIVITVTDGSAVVYGTWTDNVTQDPAIHYAH